jgi:hypothetical protein
MSNNSFIFYESWSSFIQTLDREKAKELVYQIYRVGLDMPIDTDDENIRSILEAFIIPNIKGAKRRYNASVANGKKSEGRPRATSEEQDRLIWELHLEGLTYDEIAQRMDTYGVSISRNTVGDRIRKRKESTKTNNQKLKPNIETNNETNTNTFKNKDIFIDKNINDNEEDKETEIPLHYKFN